MESIFERKFLKIYIAFYKPTRGKWRMDLFSNRIRFNFENRLSRATIPFTLKTSGRSCVRKWRVSSKRAIVSSPRVLAKETSIYALITVPWIYFKCFPLISPRSIYLNSDSEPISSLDTDKIAIFSRIHCISIPGRDLSAQWQGKPNQIQNMTRKPQSHVRILIYWL